ncbi:DUF2147 domain-containing protein [Catalinimonas sp. 4WD22]|uniref:DUF2147 domain-containing protein n=1 Tax=Catalinimonas locisalis TaxID=3133978 RepID=UPI0031015657
MYIFLFSLSANAKTQGRILERDDQILGKWYTDEKKAIVEIYQCESAYCGKITWLSRTNENGGAVKDTKNPDPEKRDRTIVGINILEDLEYSGDQSYEDGEIYDPESGKTYSCQLTLQDDGTLEVRGYLGLSFIGRSTIWTRVNEQQAEH